MSRNIFFGDKTVLLVEDDLMAAERAAEQLSALGYAEVLIATSLSQARDVLDQNSIDAAVLDVNLLGGETTIELGWTMSAENVPIVFFSGLDGEEMVRAARGHEFMEKPISLPRLKAALQRAIVRAPSHLH